MDLIEGTVWYKRGPNRQGPGLLGPLYLKWFKNGTFVNTSCIQCMLSSVYVAFSVCCMPCLLYSVYAVHSVNSWSWHGEIQRDDLTLCSAIMVELRMRKRDGGCSWEQYGGYQWIWEIRGTTCMIGFERPRIGEITHRIGTCTCLIGDGKLTCTWHSPSPSFS